MVRVSNFVKPEDLKPGLRCTMNQQSLTVVEVLPEAFDSQIYGMEVVDSPEETYDDIGGLEEQVRELKEAVELPLTRPELFSAVGIAPPKGVLLYGPPGTGKTLLARAVAHETHAHFLRVVGGSELVQKYIGEGGSRLVRELFELAKKNAPPSIIFIDEIDAIGAMRSESTTSGDREVQRTLIQLLADMDGFESRGDVKIVAATNRIDILDHALLRPGRFDRIIEIPPLPNSDGRRSIMEIHSANMALDVTVDLHEIAELTDGKNGSELRAICTEQECLPFVPNEQRSTSLILSRQLTRLPLTLPITPPSAAPPTTVRCLPENNTIFYPVLFQHSVPGMSCPFRMQIP